MMIVRISVLIVETRSKSRDCSCSFFVARVFFLYFSHILCYTPFVCFLFLFCVYVKLQILTKNGLILNIRRGEGLWDGILFFLMLFWGLGTHNLRKATKMSYKATKKYTLDTIIVVLSTIVVQCTVVL